jgi:exopolysaccharide biosynthesis protein
MKKRNHEASSTFELAVLTPQKPKHRLRKVLCGLLIASTVLGGSYLGFTYSTLPAIAQLRNTYIQTAMSTIHHKWLATAFFPDAVVQEAVNLQAEAEASMVGIESQWAEEPPEISEPAPSPSAAPETDTAPSMANISNVISTEPEASPEPTADAAEDTQEEAAEESEEAEELDAAAAAFAAEREAFLTTFYELDPDSVDAYIQKHPSVLQYGWDYLEINEAGLDDSGTEIQTKYGEQVLAIDAYNGILLIRVYVDSSRGVLAICKDTSRLQMCAASTLGSCGQTIGTICDNNGGILAVNGSAFLDDGTSNGGQISGIGICSGTVLGSRLGYGAKRLELRSDNRMYIVDSNSEISADTRDAVEFKPALIVDGTILVDNSCGWTGANPRTILGQSWYGETMILVVEGRLLSSPGCSVVSAAELLQKHYCAQALNLDGGTSSMLYYKGEYVTRCSNTSLPGGRTVPTAWVYKGKDE